MNKDELLAKFGQRRYKDLPNGLRIRSLLASEMREVRQWLVDKKGDAIPANIHALDAALFAKCVCNGDGAPVCGIDTALQLDGGVVALVGRECRTWTGFDRDADFESIEAAAKN